MYDSWRFCVTKNNIYIFGTIILAAHFASPYIGQRIWQRIRDCYYYNNVSTHNAIAWQMSSYPQ